jgi:hypothetical protein
MERCDDVLQAPPRSLAACSQQGAAKVEQAQPAVSVRKLLSIAASDRQDKVRTAIISWHVKEAYNAEVHQQIIDNSTVVAPRLVLTVLDGDWASGGNGSSLRFSLPVYIVSDSSRLLASQPVVIRKTSLI